VIPWTLFVSIFWHRRRQANLLLEAGKKKRIQGRKDFTLVRGQGEVQSYWLTKRKQRRNTYKATTGDESENETNVSVCSDLPAGLGELWDDDEGKEYRHVDFSAIPEDSNMDGRLVEWQVQSMVKLLKQIVAYQNLPEWCRVQARWL
jgi:hypothetical protein